MLWTGKGKIGEDITSFLYRLKTLLCVSSCLFPVSVCHFAVVSPCLYLMAGICFAFGLSIIQLARSQMFHQGKWERSYVRFH